MKKLTFASVLVFALALALGLECADVDQYLPWLVHRSLLTHGLLFSLLLFLLVRQRLDNLPRLFAIGFSLAMAVHLAFDLFPRSWKGFALIWIPFYGRTAAAFSWWWMAASCVVCLYLALLLMRYLLEMLLGAVSLIAAGVVHGIGERNAQLGAVALLVATIIAVLLPSRAGAVWRGLWAACHDQAEAEKFIGSADL